MLAELFRPRGGRAGRMDVLRPAREPGGLGPDVVARRDGLPDHLVAARRDQLHHDHHPAPGQGADLPAIPLFVWTQFVTAFLLLLAFPPLEAAAVMQLMDRVAGTASSSRPASSSAARFSRSPGEATRSSGSTCSGSWRTRKSTSSSFRRWESWPRSSPTTRASPCGATVRWSTRSSSSASCRSSCGRTTCS